MENRAQIFILEGSLKFGMIGKELISSNERLDIGVDYLFDIGKFNMQFGISFFNLLDRENVK